jgi:hypothetical protein
MSDLEVIVPSRGRPERLRHMLTESLRLSTAATEFTVCLDSDDDSGYDAVAWEGNFGSRVHWIRGPRMTLTGWTNLLAGRMWPHRKALASFGDDHVPETPGWDSLLLAALDRMGGTGIVYGDDKLMGENLCTAPVVSADIVAALGWMFEPSMQHMCVDCVLMDVGREAGCLAYVPEVITRHVHWCNNGAPMDATYAAAEAVKEADRERYATWQSDRMAADIAKVRALIERKAAHAAV